MGRFQYDRYSILMYMGALVGAIKGYESKDLLKVFMFSIILGFIGQQIGKGRNVIHKLIFVFVLICINEFLRNLLFSVFSKQVNL